MIKNQKGFAVPELIALLVIVAVIVSLGLSVHAHETKHSTQVTKKSDSTIQGQYVDSKTGFKIMPPPGWIKVGPVSKSLMLFRARLPNAAGQYASINILNVSSRGATLKQDMDAILLTAPLAQTNPNYKFVSLSNLTVDKISAEQLTYTSTSTSTSPVEQLTTSQLVLIKNNLAWIVTGVAASNAWNKDGPLIQRSMLSFQP